MKVLSTLKYIEILKYTHFRVIPYIHSLMMGLFPHMSMVTMTISKKILLQPSPEIPSLTILLNKIFHS